MTGAAVGPNRRVSGVRPVPCSESDIRMDDLPLNRIIAAANNSGGPQAQFFSSDGGITWGQTTLPLVLGDSLHSDPTVGWTSDGAAWAVTIGIQFDIFGNPSLQLRAYRSRDGGATWNFDGTVSGAQTAADKELMWVDRSPTSPFANNIYVIWHNGQPAFVNRRTGPTGAWQTPVQVSGPETTGTAIGGDITTNAAGEVFAFWPDTGSRRLLVTKSTNGGATFRPPTVIATTFGAFWMPVPSSAARPPFVYISGAAFRDAATSFVYAVWTDLTGSAGCTSDANAPGGTVTSPCKTRIWFARSTDDGVTWQRPIMINDQASRNDQYMPRMAVDTDGTITVVYYDTVGDPRRLKTDLWYQSSPDFGTTWTSAVKVTNQQTDETSAGADPYNQYGDYNGLSGYEGTFFPSWTDRRFGGREEIWTAQLWPDSVTDYILMGMIAQP